MLKHTTSAQLSQQPEASLAVQKSRGKPCSSGVTHDRIIEDCADSCKPFMCHMCLCKRCKTCGAKEGGIDWPGCSSPITLLPDVGGQLSLEPAQWTPFEVVVLSSATLDTSLSVDDDAGGGANAKWYRAASPKLFGQGAVELLPLKYQVDDDDESSRPRVNYHYAGPTAQFEVTCHTKSPPSPPPPPLTPPPTCPPNPNLPPPPRHPWPASPPLPPPCSSPPPSPPPPHPHASPAPPLHAADATRQETRSCMSADDPVPPPLVFPMSTASWTLKLPVAADTKPCDANMRWDVAFQHGVTKELLPPVSGLLTETGIRLESVRCPPRAFPTGCSFALRVHRSLPPFAAWSPFSESASSFPSAPPLPGTVRFEARFAMPDRAHVVNWTGSVAERFQMEVARQTAVSPRSVRIVDRFGEGQFVVFDLIPFDLALEPLVARFHAALAAKPSAFGASAVRTVFHDGHTEPFFTAPVGWVSGAMLSGKAMAGLCAAVALPTLSCLYLMLSWKRKQLKQRSRERLRLVGPRQTRSFNSQDEEELDVSTSGVPVVFEEEGGDITELFVSLHGVSTVPALREAVWKHGNAFLPRRLPPLGSLRFTFDYGGAEHTLASDTPVALALQASTFRVLTAKKPQAGSRSYGQPVAGRNGGASGKGQAVALQRAGELRAADGQRRADCKSGTNGASRSGQLSAKALSNGLVDEQDEEEVSPLRTNRLGGNFPKPQMDADEKSFRGSNATVKSDSDMLLALD